MHPQLISHIGGIRATVACNALSWNNACLSRAAALLLKTRSLGGLFLLSYTSCLAFPHSVSYDFVNDFAHRYQGQKVMLQIKAKCSSNLFLAVFVSSKIFFINLFIITVLTLCLVFLHKKITFAGIFGNCFVSESQKIILEFFGTNFVFKGIKMFTYFVWRRGKKLNMLQLFIDFDDLFFIWIIIVDIPIKNYENFKNLQIV